MTNIVDDFPHGICDIEDRNEDANPAIKLFGRRFFADQQVMELLGEFFLVLTSAKSIDGHAPFNDFLPDLELLKNWPEHESSLKYSPRAKLNLKLFSFLGSSRLETRHETHRKHCQELWDALKNKINADDNDQKEDILCLLSNLFLGFWGTGAQRTWCAQSFLPFCEGVLSGEAIWNESAARADSNLVEWNSILANFQSLFTLNKHRFLARGGEMLYLQLCNALRQPADKISEWLKTTGRQEGLTDEERNPERLHAGLQNAFAGFFQRTPDALNNLADFIDRKVESETSESSDQDSRGGRKVECGWCAEESWREGYLFAVELLRLLRANIDIMETVDLLQIACAMQLMRSLAAQSYRHSPNFECDSDGLDYRILISDPDGENRRIKEFSRTCLTNVCREIYDAIRIEPIRGTIDSEDQIKTYKEADDRYGHKLYRKTGKVIGLIVPRRGSGSRFIMTDKILRYLVLSLVPMYRMTLDSFTRQIELHHGFVFDEIRLASSPNWKDKHDQLVSSTVRPAYLEQMLDASGALVKLSDSCSLVKNPFHAEVR